MGAVFKRELKSYFSSPVGYVCVAVLVALYGLMYFQVMLYGSSAYIPSIVFDSMFMFNMMIIPIITMRSLSEDKKNKTDQALLTAPVGVTGIVLGKFFACLGVYLIATTIGGLAPAVAMESFSEPPWGEIMGNYIATVLYGAAMISIGVFISSLTESQIIAAVATFAVSMIILFSANFVGSSPNEVVTLLITWLSFTVRYDTFVQGVFDVSSTVFFISVVAIFVFLTARRVESRRWN